MLVFRELPGSRAAGAHVQTGYSESQDHVRCVQLVSNFASRQRDCLQCSAACQRSAGESEICPNLTIKTRQVVGGTNIGEKPYFCFRHRDGAFLCSDSKWSGRGQSKATTNSIREVSILIRKG